MVGLRVYWTMAFIALMGYIAQGQSGAVTFSAEADARQVPLSGYFNITYSLNNAGGTSFQPPNFKKDFKILNGPSRQISTSIYNGRSTSKMKLTYVLQPKSIGKFKIAPAVIYADGHKMTSNSVSVEVIKGKQQLATGTDKPLEEQVFVRIEVDTTIAYIGQQVIIDYILYTAVKISNYNIISESSYDGCFAQNIRTFNNRQQQKIVDGVQYVTQVLKRVALFPQQNGVIKIEPANLQLGINTGRRTNSFFGGFQTKTHYTNTNSLEINVKALPQDAPTSFTGGIGQFKISAQHSDSNVTTDDGVSIKFSIIGNGDMKRVSAPTITSPLAANGKPAFEIYEPTLKNDASYENGGHIEGRKDYEYLLLPKEPGIYQVNPQFTYFDTDNSSFVTNSIYKFPITVRQGTGVPSDKALTQESIQKDHLRSYTSNVPLHDIPNFIVQQPWYWVLFGLPILGILGLVGFQQYQASKGEIDLDELARKKAEKVARQKLAQAEGFMKLNDAKAFYKEISTAYLGYVNDKLAIQTADLSKSNVASHLATLSVSTVRIEKFVGIMNSTDMALYSGRTSPQDMQSFYDEAVKVVISVEQEIQD